MGPLGCEVTATMPVTVPCASPEDSKDSLFFFNFGVLMWMFFPCPDILLREGSL